MKSSFVTTQMDLKDIMLCEIRQRETNTIWSLLYVESKKYIYINFKNEKAHRYKNQTAGCQGLR